MGYGYYEVDGMDRGYMVDDTCHHDGCSKTINRGLSYLCYACTLYFCEKHLTQAYCQHDEPMLFDCFAGQSSQCCLGCATGEHVFWDCDGLDCH